MSKMGTTSGTYKTMITAQSIPKIKKREIIQYFIEASDVGKSAKDVYVDNKRILISFKDSLARVSEYDIGKRMLYNEECNHWSVENDEQFHARTRR